MYWSIIITFFLFLVLGILFNFILFKKDKNEVHRNNFVTSERLIIFIVEIIIAVIGFGVTLAITNANERQIEKEKAIHMLEQTIEYTDKQLEKDSSYISGYVKGKYTNRVYVNSDVISIDYYKNITSNEVILQNANMNTYGDIMTYLLWLEYYDTKAKIAGENSAKDDCYNKDDLSDISSVYVNMYNRRKYLEKVRELLSACCQELSGEISFEEAQQRCHEIRYGSSNNNDKTETSTDIDVQTP